MCAIRHIVYCAEKCIIKRKGIQKKNDKSNRKPTEDVGGLAAAV